MNSAEADQMVAALVHEDRLRKSQEEIGRLQIEARFYQSPEWADYLAEVLEPRYRARADELTAAEDTATMLRLQGEARALKFQIDRAESVVRDLEEKKVQYEKQQRTLRDAAGIGRG